MSYTARNTQTQAETMEFDGPWEALDEAITQLEWEESETVLLETQSGDTFAAAFPCTAGYRHPSGEFIECVEYSNFPDSLCPFHAGEED